jgi:uncharacterized membrane protein
VDKMSGALVGERMSIRNWAGIAFIAVRAILVAQEF